MFRVLLVACVAGFIGMLWGGVAVDTRTFPFRFIAPFVNQVSDAYVDFFKPQWVAMENLTLEERTYAETTNEGKFATDRKYNSNIMGVELDVPAGVFWPNEAEGEMLPIMERNPYLFKGKRVLEIGTGTGIVSLQAARLGAVKVVSTDISQLAVDTATRNAENLGYGDIIDVRLVPPEDLSAYSVIGDDEQFDVIISNPPYAIDLDAPTTTAVIDNGDLGFSIVRGFEKHLAKDGTAVLFYGSAFFHEVMAKFAAYEGYDVKNHSAVGLFGWEAEALFNYYLRRLLAQEGVDPKAFNFNYEEDQALRNDFLKNMSLTASDVRPARLLEKQKGWSWYPGMIIIRHPD